MPAPAVEIHEVTKTFGPQTAVDKLSLDVPERSICGFIGPNGSGKTTTLRMIMRILHPNSGTIRVLGDDVLHAVNDRVAYLPEERGLYKQMTVIEVLEYYAALKGMRRASAKKEIDTWLERLGLAAHAKKKVAALSKGMSQKVQFIATVVTRPALVLLDEPFSGLDPVNAVVLREAILELRDQATVIFSTHDMGVAEQMCDFIFMIHRGRKVLDGTLAQIQDAWGSDTIRVSLASGSIGNDGNDGNGKPTSADFARLTTLPGVVEVTNFGNLQELRLTDNADPQRILAELMKRGSVRHFEVARPSLQEIFMRIASPETKAESLARIKIKLEAEAAAAAASAAGEPNA